METENIIPFRVVDGPGAKKQVKIEDITIEKNTDPKKTGKEIADFLRDTDADDGDYFHESLVHLLKAIHQQNVLTDHQLAVMLYSLFVSLWENELIKGADDDPDLSDVQETLERKVHEVRKELGYFLQFQRETLGALLGVFEGIIFPKGLDEELTERSENMEEGEDGDARRGSAFPKTDRQIIEEFRKTRKDERDPTPRESTDSLEFRASWKKQERWEQLDVIMECIDQLAEYLNELIKANKEADKQGVYTLLVDIHVLAARLDPFLRTTGFLDKDDIFWDETIRIDTLQQIMKQLKELKIVKQLLLQELFERDYMEMYHLISDYRKALEDASDAEEDEEGEDDDKGGADEGDKADEEDEVDEI